MDTSTEIALAAAAGIAIFGYFYLSGGGGYDEDDPLGLTPENATRERCQEFYKAADQINGDGGGVAGGIKYFFHHPLDATSALLGGGVKPETQAACKCAMLSPTGKCEDPSPAVCAAERAELLALAGAGQDPSPIKCSANRQFWKDAMDARQAKQDKKARGEIDDFKCFQQHWDIVSAYVKRELNQQELANASQYYNRLYDGLSKAGLTNCDNFDKNFRDALAKMEAEARFQRVSQSQQDCQRSVKAKIDNIAQSKFWKTAADFRRAVLQANVGSQCQGVDPTTTIDNALTSASVKTCDNSFAADNSDPIFVQYRNDVVAAVNGGALHNIFSIMKSYLDKHPQYKQCGRADRFANFAAPYIARLKQQQECETKVANWKKAVDDIVSDYSKSTADKSVAQLNSLLDGYGDCASPALYQEAFAYYRQQRDAKTKPVDPNVSHYQSMDDKVKDGLYEKRINSDGTVSYGLTPKGTLVDREQAYLKQLEQYVTSNANKLDASDIPKAPDMTWLYPQLK